jgi:cytochrome c biogenesis protein CcmG/thiol:disulfide interchange protein DsbE
LNVKRNIVIGGILAVIVGVMLYASSKVPHSGLVGGAGTQAAPDFRLKDINGNTFSLSDLHGKAVVLNFWATWCPPCKEEIPWFVDLQNKYGSQGLQIVGVSMDEGGKDAVVPFAKEMGINYEVLLGTPEVGDLYGGVNALPTTFYIGRDGKVLEYVPGLIGRREMEENIKAALATSGTQTQTARK